MPKCISCNEVFPDQLRRCPHCGYTTEPAPPEARRAQERRKARRRKGGLRPGRLAVILAVVAVGGLAAVISWPRPTPHDPSTDFAPQPEWRTETPELPPEIIITEEIEPDPVERDLQVTEARVDRGEVVVSGTCSPLAVVEVRVNGKRATIRPDGRGFHARVPIDGEAVQVTAHGIRGDSATLTKPVARENGESGTGERVRLLSHADGATVYENLVELAYTSWGGAGPMHRIEARLAGVENLVSIERDRFVLYRAPEGLTFLRTTAAGIYTFVRHADNQEMLLIPAGVSKRGMGTEEPDGPAHLVELSPFLIDRTEVTCEQYSRFLQVTRRRRDFYRHPEDPNVVMRPVGWTTDVPPAGTENLPVTGICWYAAYAYARWAGGRLPTEAEWERAAAGPFGRAYPWSDAFDPARCRAAAPQPLPAASLLDGESYYGLLHASGNVREWCYDRFDPRWYTRGSRRDPCGPAFNAHRVVRGGSFGSPATQLRLQRRDHFDATKKAADLGFRVARSWDNR